MSKWKDFYIDDSPNGQRFFIEAELVSREEFLARRDKECYHRFSGNPSDMCIDCGFVRKTEKK